MMDAPEHALLTLTLLSPPAVASLQFWPPAISTGASTLALLLGAEGPGAEVEADVEGVGGAAGLGDEAVAGSLEKVLSGLRPEAKVWCNEDRARTICQRAGQLLIA